MKLFVPIKCTLNLIVLKKSILHKYNLSFQMFSIKKLKASKPKPYSNPLKVKVIGVGDKSTYTTADGKEKKLVPLGVADKEDSIKVSLYEVDKLQLLKAGECVVLSNYVYRVDPHPTIVVTAVTRVMKTSSFAVPEDVETTAKAIANPAPAKIITIQDAKRSPIKSLVSIKGRVISVCFNTSSILNSISQNCEYVIFTRNFINVLSRKFLTSF